MNNKILFILHMPPPIHGAAMVGKYIHDSDLINGQFECRYINLTTASSLQDIGRFSLSKIVAYSKLLVNIWRVVKQFVPNLVYVTPNAKGGAFYKDFVVVQMLKVLGCKIVIHYHNKGVRSRQGKWLDNLLYQRFYKNVKVILLGKPLYKDVEKYVKWDDVYICPNGIPRSNDEDRSPKLVVNDVPRLLFLSNLIENKGVIVLLDALKIIKDNGSTYVCDIVGGETAEIDAQRFEEEVAKRSLEGFVIYKGKKYGIDKLKEYQQTDIFVFPTYYDNECFPLVLLEAMEQRLPCISTTEGAISAIIDDNVNGLIAERNNPQALAEKIIFLLNNKELRRKMGNAGWQKFQSEFTLERFEKRMCDILKQIV